jgi:CheY-like chemotaxis protein/two-component sensor histidine kinase
LGWVGEARAPDATPEAVAYALTIIEQRARIARDLARHAIGSTRIDEQSPAAEIARDVALSLRVEASRAGVTIDIQGGDVAALVAGALDVAQVLTNLVLNAIAHAPNGSRITIDLTSDDERCSLVVTDEGPGVPADIRDAIFHGESRRPGGTGIGLRHARALSRAWGGDVVLLDSQAGASFRVTWPRVDIVPRPPMSAARAREFAGMRVLLVEDDEAVVQLLETALEGRGAEVTVVANGTELSAAMSGAPYEAALVDLSPIADDPSGALERLRTSSPGIDVVLISGSADRLPDAVATESIKLVRKPFELREVFAALSAGKK